MDQSRPGASWEHLKHDVTFRIATLYAGVSWFLVEAADTLGAAASFRRSFALVLGLGWVDANDLGFSWYHNAMLLARSPRYRPQAVRMLRWQVVSDHRQPAASWQPEADAAKAALRRLAPDR